ncbi:bifunctional [glutamine synthetase] adenylyltransferase/[glutamine synthetase]-adenylyl-L-tyrosine phosphorylase [Isoptericola sp. NEAU-Y5]|uniref:Bifunctional glutamine synthetase adenylyltransferase/adenylyl-removing enzyme n=1 Tax=Isoptericola luteus TaxID=2879484 RepID=A0ABS7ZM81_9MICO|nr:bifunctional [glutamine synthetase] adenylyltransferase/[glutamine synthetase]-adenylyl-L-tyrosine phosphorylase [Isoptericola sp. NEAU-Y5]MCA5894994.1 bifunctional [glutamine synthetase] adenylyltransferase/[glutamine synthetase]-adenylyl-L-tyrosine phosphorylase [Isoptericola sp. NEAU-Y5]
MSTASGAGRQATLTRRLLQAGFADLTRSAGLWEDEALQAALPPDGGDVVLAALGGAADPDLALLQLVRLAESVGDSARLGAVLAADDGSPDAQVRGRLVAVLGASSALGDEIVRRPELLAVLAGDFPRTSPAPADDGPGPGESGPGSGSGPGSVQSVQSADEPGADGARTDDAAVFLAAGDVAAGAGPAPDPALVRSELLRAVGADPADGVPVAASPDGEPGVAWPDAAAPTTTDALRRAYRARLLRIAAADLTAPDPLTRLPAVAAALADLAAAAIEAALAVARAEVGEPCAGVRLAVIGMGKTGGRELNYVSDVDVVYVCEPGERADGSTPSEDEALAAGTRLASGLQRVCSGASGEPALWQVDAALRPEGKQGPLVRTLDSHVAYYERWAETWEFQALLKARPIAGDADLGRAYREAVDPFVWSAVHRDNFVEDSRAMRRRVEDHVPPAEADRQIKLGKGGLRDVEFTVQLLQLVHGRTDQNLHSPHTLSALTALAAQGYVGRDHAARMSVCYRFLRALEHRVQLFRLRRTHLLPTAEEDLRRLARSLGMRSDGAAGLLERWRATRREVRSLHEEVFYRPLLPASAQLSDDELALAPDAARERFAAIGYRDPDGAMRHVTALTAGTSRRAALQRQLLPVLLGWFAEGGDPDAGLLAFRKLSEDLGATPWYLRLLRDSENAAYHLSRLLSSSRYLADALARSPESVQWLADIKGLEPRGPQRLAGEADAVLTRAEESEPAATRLRAVRRRELARTGAAEVLGLIDAVDAAAAISDAADMVLVGGLRVARFAAREELGLGQDPAADPTRMLVVAMGRLGGREMGYGSDADVMFVHDPVAGADPQAAQEFAQLTATRLRSLLSAVGKEPALPVDADLRPEGRQGPLVRTLDSYAEYYERWSSVWESQALLRARPVAGDISGAEDDATLAARFTALADRARYPVGGLDEGRLREVRRIKARVEAERLPRGADPSRHLKLGRGGVSDVEWTVQLLQLQHAHAVPAMRTTGTVTALDAAQAAGLVDPDDTSCLRDAWYFASRLRSAVVLWSGRTTGAQVDILPHDRRELAGIANLMGDVGTGAELEDLYLRTARRARSVVERVFYGEE